MNAGTDGLRAQVDHLAAAWEWVLRLREDDASPEHLAEWLQWYEADPRHRAAFEEMQAFWREAGKLADDPQIAELLGRSDERSHTSPAAAPPRPRRAFVWAGISLAAAASVALVIGLGLFSFTPTPALVHEKELSDGSVVQLAARSTISVQFTARERRLQMRDGEAYFSVSKDPARPFVVEVGNLQVRALGTAFNIRRAYLRTVVTVTEGAVEVRNGSDTRRGTAGEQLIFDGQSGQLEQAPVDTSHVLAWQQGRLEYLNEPLAAVIADVNRYSPHPVVIADRTLEGILFSGTVFTNQTDAWLRALPRVFAVQTQTRSDKSVVLSARN